MTDVRPSPVCSGAPDVRAHRPPVRKDLRPPRIDQISDPLCVMHENGVF